MCGIAGIVGRPDAANRDALRRMARAMSHRGPDAEGLWESAPDAEGRAVLFAHRRLSIIDLSDAGRQPMVDPMSGDAVVLNGEIYNYVALRAELADPGHPLSSTGDVAAALRALAVRGPGALPSLRGMFALGFYDVSEGRLLLARDPLGIKPLYLARNPEAGGAWSLAFASEVRALLAAGLLRSPRLDPQAVASVIWNGFVTGPGTAVAGIEQLAPGELRVFDRAGRETHAERYWNLRRPAAGSAPIGEEQLAADLQECVRLHLAADVPLAVFLSSGVDSSAVANLARRAGTGPVHTFTLAFEEPELDESPVSREIARAIGTEHRQVTLTEGRFVSQLDRALDALDQPSFDGLNTYYMSEAVREAGFKVALVGTGGDELFGGYASFRQLPVLHAWWRRTRALPAPLRVGAARLVSALLAPRRGAVGPQTRWAKLPDMVRQGDDLLALYQLAYALFLPAFQRELLAPPLREVLQDGLDAPLREGLREETAGRSPLPALSVLEERLFLSERLLRDSDAASMAPSLELRLPLVDQVLFERVDRMADEARYLPLGRKAVLRRIGLAGLDPALFDRPKRGFVLPFDRWIRRTLGAAMDQTLRDPAQLAPLGLDPAAVGRLWTAFQDGAPGMYWSRIWAIFVLVRWCQRQGVFL